ncbi:hypothetical protein CAEBREN_22296 [Caenorhabditis brenneri]|uniref:Uncharacterized protein n=1 Tax=Caenorhabditis brenneri TaxID=135651 RepID=G0NF95_CAEBE|nr:hypothetical protein CAEBREN_22296 [Caenorhabditis brenneri]
MSGSQRRQYIPEHAVPVPLSLVANATTERVEFGKVELVRVQVMGIVHSVDLHNAYADIIILEKDGDECLLCRKVFDPNFSPERAQELVPGHMVEVYGKIRLLEDKTPYLNVFTFLPVSVPQFEAFQTMNTPALPGGTHCKYPERKGLSKKLGNLHRFPMQFLEQSSSVENNGGQWPPEIEQLAAGMPINKSRKRRREESDEEEEEKYEKKEDYYEEGEGAAEMAEGGEAV